MIMTDAGNTRECFLGSNNNNGIWQKICPSSTHFFKGKSNNHAKDLNIKKENVIMFYV